MSCFFTSDLHLGHLSVATRLRGFKSVVEHDWCIIGSLSAQLNKRDKLYIVGDIAWNNQALKLLNEIKCLKVAVLGNHDNMRAREYLTVFHDLHGFLQYKKWWVGHAPIHPQELRGRGQIHGHIHPLTGGGDLGKPYFNVNIEAHNWMAVQWEDIRDCRWPSPEDKL